MKNKVINLFGNNKIVPNKGVKYSELLEQFMYPFMNRFKDYENIGDIIEFSINAWNMGNIKVLLPKEGFKEIISNAPNQEDIDFHLLKKMIDFKAKKFKEYTNFIADYELKEVNDGGDPVLTVITQESEAYLSNMANGIEENNMHGQEDFEENYINRNAIIIKPQQAFIDWLGNLYPDNIFIEDVKKSNIYLVDDDIDDIEKWLKKKFDTFFTMELQDWHTNKKEWPQKRNYKMFNLWFDIEISEMIYDLERKPVLKSE